MFDWIEDGFRLLMTLLSTWIYEVIIWLYDIFMKLCNSRVLDSDVIELIAGRVGVILGLIMLFMTMFSVVQLVLEPEKLTDKEKGIGNIVKKILVVIVMLGMSSSAFGLMYGVQKTVINSNIIAKFLLPYDVDTTNFGGLLASELFTAFYKFDDNLALDGLDSTEQGCMDKLTTLKSEIAEYGEFGRATDSKNTGCLNAKSGDYYMVDLNALLLPIVGAFAVYFIFSYCLSVGMRTFQLAFLEIISPMAIVSYLSPKKDTMFQKWWKIYFSTYIDVFLRIAIINVAVFLIAVIFDANMSGTFWESVGGKTTGWIDTIMTIFIIMSLLMFAKKAPDLLKELFPSGASKLGMGITPPKKLIDNMAGADLIKRGYGAVNVGARSWARNTRKAIGNVWDEMHDESSNTEKRTKAWLRLGSALTTGGLGGMRRGLMTTDASGRNRATDNAYAARQSTYKMRDLNYGSSLVGLLTKPGRAAAKEQGKDFIRSLAMKDLRVDDMGNLTDLNVETLQQRLIELQKKASSEVSVLKAQSENGSYLVKIGKGEAHMMSKDDFEKSLEKVSDPAMKEALEAARDIADLKSQIGKAQSDSKKLHQKAEEQKQKANGGKK